MIFPKDVIEPIQMIIDLLGGGFTHFLFSLLFGEDSHFDKYFSKGLVQPPISLDRYVDVGISSD